MLSSVSRRISSLDTSFRFIVFTAYTTEGLLIRDTYLTCPNFPVPSIFPREYMVVMSSRDEVLSVGTDDGNHVPGSMDICFLEGVESMLLTDWSLEEHNGPIYGMNYAIAFIYKNNNMFKE